MTTRLQPTLLDKPNWWVSVTLKWLALVSFLLAPVFFIISIYSYVVSDRPLNPDAEFENQVFVNASHLSAESANYGFTLIIYAFVILVVAAISDKIDQLVWLNASDEDRQDILAKRKKKNVKN